MYQYSGRSQMGGVLEDKGSKGVVFCSKNHMPIYGYGVYNIIRNGTDKNGRRYSIAEPVVPVSTSDVAVFKAAENIHSWPDSVYCKRLQKAYPGIEKKGLFGLVKLLQSEDYGRIGVIALNPVGVPADHFYVNRNCCTDLKLKPSAMVSVTYGDGQQGHVPASWVYKNRAKLVDTEITVFGDKADNLRLSFSRCT